MICDSRERQGEAQQERKAFSKRVARDHTRGIPLGELPSSEAGPLQLLGVPLDSTDKPADPRRLSGFQIPVRARGPLNPCGSRRDIMSGIEGLFPPDGFGNLEEMKRLAIVSLH